MTGSSSGATMSESPAFYLLTLLLFSLFVDVVVLLQHFTIINKQVLHTMC